MPDIPESAPPRDLSDPTPFRRSSRASRARRAAAVRSRRLGRSRRSLVAIVAALGVGAGGAFAADAGPRSSAPVTAVQQALGITADGIAGPQTRKAIRAFQRAHGLTVDGIVGPQTLAALGVKAGAPAASRTRAVNDPEAAAAAAQTADAGSLLEALALCESGGNPTAISPTGRYRGKYQFSRATWKRLGGTGDPAAAPEAEQDRIAAKLLAAEGTAPWPACSRKIGAAS